MSIEKLIKKGPKKQNLDTESKKYFRGLLDELLYKDLGDDQEIFQRESARKKVIKSKADEMMKIIDKKDSQLEFAKITDPGIIVELNKRVFELMIK